MELMTMFSNISSRNRSEVPKLDVHKRKALLERLLMRVIREGGFACVHIERTAIIFGRDGGHD